MTAAHKTDLLDLSKNRLADLPTRPSSKGDQWMKYLGFPLGIGLFLVLFYLPTPEGMTRAAQVVIACFTTALIWWVAEPVPTYVTSLLLMGMLVFFDGWSEKNVLGVLGFDVIWLNVLAFILSSMMIKTNLAKRLALALIVRFGHNAYQITLAFFLLNLFLAGLIPATAARAAMLLPILLVIAAIYGSTHQNSNNFGKNLLLQNMQAIDFGSSAFMTGSNANIIAIAFILSMGSTRIYYSDWLFANLPVVVTAMLIGWFIGPRWVFRLKNEEKVPQLEGGLERMRLELKKMGPIGIGEIKSLMIFGMVIFLWVTDKQHLSWFGFDISAVMAAFIGVLIAFFPKIGILKWNEADIPWHLMIFSCGAYAGGLALNDTGAANWLVGRLFDFLNIQPGINFWLVYVIVIVVNMYSHLFFTSKTMRTLIMIPFTIAMAKQLGFDPVWLALPAAFTIDWVISLPINAKPNVIMYSTGQYSTLENLKYGIIMTTIGAILLIIAGFTWFRILGITPRFQ